MFGTNIAEKTETRIVYPVIFSVRIFVFEIIKQKEMNTPEFICYVYLLIFDMGFTKKNYQVFRHL
jgi:hypothetical protein